MFSAVATHALAFRSRPTGRSSCWICRPTQVERHFPASEIIVSKTDRDGRLTYVSRLFTTISDYSEAELLGRPHSLLRHPDMPRAVFRLLWERLSEGREAFAYIKNMTKGGDHYWALAHLAPEVGPTGETIGYHASRRAADRQVLEGTIVPLYRSLREIELREADPRDGLRRSSERLSAMLAEQGVDYAEFLFGLRDGHARLS